METNVDLKEEFKKKIEHAFQCDEIMDI